MTLLTQESVIELKDSIWQSYSLSLTTAFTHFYFHPKHKNKTINIIYNSTFKDLSLMYKVFDASKNKYDPTNWSFLHVDKVSTTKPVHHVSISPENLKKSWPNCVVLMSLSGIQRETIKNAPQR
jgi:hypothetical protein